MEGEDAAKLMSRLVKMTPRSVCLTASDRRAEEWKTFVKEKTGYATFSSRDIEASKTDFVSHNSAVAILAGRFDGIDFPKDESRLLLIDDLPSMVNFATERRLECYKQSVDAPDRSLTHLL
jgi:Rad3-related DNA helicase